MYCTLKAKQKEKLYSKQEPLKISVFVRQYAGMLYGLDTDPGFMSVTQKWPLPELGRRKLRGNILRTAAPSSAHFSLSHHPPTPPPPWHPNLAFKECEIMHQHVTARNSRNTLSSRSVVRWTSPRKDVCGSRCLLGGGDATPPSPIWIWGGENLLY